MTGDDLHVQTRREFVITVGGFLITMPLLMRETSGASVNIAAPVNAGDLRRLVLSGWIAGGEDGAERPDVLIARAASLCEPNVNADDILRDDIELPDLKKLRVDSVEKWELVQAIRRVQSDAQRIFKSARQWDIESIERFARNRLGELGKSLDLDSFVSKHAQKLKLPKELESWVRSPDKALDKVVDGLEERVKRSLPPFIRGVADGSALRELRTTGEALIRDSLSKAIGLDKLGLKKSFSEMNGVLSTFKDDIAQSFKKPFLELQKGFDKTLSGMFSGSKSALPGMTSLVVVGAVAGVVSGLMNRGKLDSIKKQLAEVNRRLDAIEAKLGRLTDEMQKIRRELSDVAADVKSLLEYSEHIDRQIWSMRKGQRERLLSRYLMISELSTDNRTGLFTPIAAPQVLEKAAEMAGAEFGLVGDADWNVEFADLQPNSDKPVLEEPLAGQIGLCVKTVQRQLQSGYGNPISNPGVWYEGAKMALLALPNVDPQSPSKKYGQLPKDLVEKIVNKGTGLITGLRELARSENVQPLSDRFVSWWTDEKKPNEKMQGERLLRDAINDCRKELKYLKLERIEPEVSHDGALPYRPFWRGRDTTVYYLDTMANGNQILYKIAGMDPFEFDSKTWTISKSYRDKNKKLISARDDFRDCYYETVSGIPYSPPSSVSRYFRDMVVNDVFPPIVVDNAGGNPARVTHRDIQTDIQRPPRKGTGETIISLAEQNKSSSVFAPATFTETYLDFGGGGSLLPTSILRCSNNLQRPATEIVRQAYVAVEQSTGALKWAIEKAVRTRVKNHPDWPELKNMFGAIGGAVTLAAWHKTDDAMDCFPPLLDGDSQIPACIPGIIQILCEDYLYADPHVSVETVMEAFSARFRKRIRYALEFVKDSEKLERAPGIPVLTRMLFDLKAAVGLPV